MENRFSRYYILLAVVALLAGVGFLSSCSTKKNTAASRNYQAFITRYNVYYNGDSHFKETLKELEARYEDDYSQRLFMHPVEAYGHPKSPQPSGSFDRSIEKAQKAIQLHSIKKRPAKKPGRNSDPAYKAWLKRSEYNPFLHNAWMLMGESQYYKGDFAGAAATFYYISKNFSWLPDVVTSALLWQARSYCAMDWLYEAENILVRVKEDQLTTKKLRELYYFTYADYYVRSGQYEKAAPMLTEAIGYAHGSQKIRLNFLLGQVYAAVDDRQRAYDAFKRAGGSSGASYRAKFNARIKQSEVYMGENIEPEVKSLRRMTRYDRNKEYLDQIYYAIGNLYLSRKDTTQAIENYKLAVEKSTRSGIDKALAALRLGNLYFEQGRYDLAQPMLSEAVPQLPDDYPDYKAIKKRSDVLDELAVYSQNVVLQDSLLTLAKMTPEEQMAVAERLVKELKEKEKKEAEEAAAAEYMAQQAAAGTGLQDKNAPQQFQMNTDDSWYFYNQTTKNAGKTEFQKRWGSRKLEDDWRRRNKTTFNLGNDDEAASEDELPLDDLAADSTAVAPEDSVAANKANDPHFPEYYLKQIPSTPEEIQTSNDIIQEGLFNMGLILKDKLEDFPAARSEFDQLLRRYPDNVYRLDVYYNLYLMYMREDRPAEAEKWRRLIVQDFPESKYGQAMADPEYLRKLREMDRRQEELYAQTYEDYMENRTAAVHRNYAEMMRDYPLSTLMPKFMFLDALSYVTENNPEKFKEVLTELVQRYPQADVTPLASSYVKGLNEGRELHKATTTPRAMLWDQRLTNDSTLLAQGLDGPIEFENNPDSPQLLVLLFSTDSISPNQLLYDVARHNFNTFTVRDFDLEVMNFGRLGMLIIKGFSNLRELEHYRTLLTSDTGFNLPPGVRPVMISQANFDALLRGGRSFDEYFRFMGDKLIDEVHEETLPAEEYPAADEMYKEFREEGPAEEGQETPSVTPVTPVAPATPVTPTLPQGPEVPTGSEGDDPLLDF